ncbi:iron-sulfur cluster assembly scaffold protein [Erythrobacter sp. GH3-10]|uniref:Iron-sulfur cluster assembly scaffold protein n=2 Tax=Aurantiacibacter rhizosphaerae TaxID=2691582 RepID=A0A844XDE2_9SPHN|nr:iron-sulfur cluster assembly scaffold protein [Aurantiacibacter rhizosphaerae]
MLSAAVELANFPPLQTARLHGSARAPACGSTLEMGLDLDEGGAIAAIGMKVRACAVGQAAAAIFARHAAGRTAQEIGETLDGLTAWLEQYGAMPAWPDLSLIAPARDYRGRHGAMLLPWNAAAAALSSTANAR